MEHNIQQISTKVYNKFLKQYQKTKHNYFQQDKSRSKQQRK